MAAEPEYYTARCYCGALFLGLEGPVGPVTYCHCSDCKRWTGAPAPAFAAFAAGALHWRPGPPSPQQHTPGVNRWVCADCGSAMACSFDYLPDQVYVPLGVIDQIEDLAPSLHCHADARVAWLDNGADIQSVTGSGRETLLGNSNRDET